MINRIGQLWSISVSYRFLDPLHSHYILITSSTCIKNGIMRHKFVYTHAPFVSTIGAHGDDDEFNDCLWETNYNRLRIA